MNGDLDVSGNRLAVLQSGLVAILFHSGHSGFPKRLRPGEGRCRLDVADDIDGGVDSDISCDEIAQSLRRDNRAHGTNEFRRQETACIWSGGSWSRRGFV